MEELIFKTESFEGPLDLLEHLIKKNKLDICTVSLIEITDQYIEHINQMEEMNLEVSADFLLVASNLLYIKSKALLPKHEDEDDDSEDIANNLTEALKERARMKIISERFRTMQYDGTFRYFKEEEKIEKPPVQRKLENLDVHKLYDAFMTVLEKTERRAPPSKSNFTGIVGREPVSVKEKAGSLIHRLRKDKKVRFEQVFENARHKNEVVAIFLAILELMKLNHILAYEEDDKILIRIGDNVSENTEEILSNISGD
ncbi:MAG: segregation/condensation protein A [Clostridia bacterium]|nr:segregation/condensation protein A [Clostridia bacterium]